jgi:hypothetical protein
MGMSFMLVSSKVIIVLAVVPDLLLIRGTRGDSWNWRNQDGNTAGITLPSAGTNRVDSGNKC